MDTKEMDRKLIGIDPEVSYSGHTLRQFSVSLYPNEMTPVLKDAERQIEFSDAKTEWFRHISSPKPVMSIEEKERIQISLASHSSEIALAFQATGIVFSGEKKLSMTSFFNKSVVQLDEFMIEHGRMSAIDYPEVKFSVGILKDFDDELHYRIEGKCYAEHEKALLDVIKHNELFKGMDIYSNNEFICENDGSIKNQPRRYTGGKRYIILNLPDCTPMLSKSELYNQNSDFHKAFFDLLKKDCAVYQKGILNEEFRGDTHCSISHYFRKNNGDEVIFKQSDQYPSSQTYGNNMYFSTVIFNVSPKSKLPQEIQKFFEEQKLLFRVIRDEIIPNDSERLYKFFTGVNDNYKIETVLDRSKVANLTPDDKIVRKKGRRL